MAAFSEMGIREIQAGLTAGDFSAKEVAEAGAEKVAKEVVEAGTEKAVNDKFTEIKTILRRILTGGAE